MGLEPTTLYTPHVHVHIRVWFSSCVPPTTHHSVLVHELYNNGGWGLLHLAGVAKDTDALDEDGLVPGGADSLGDGACPVTPCVERQHAVRVCGYESQQSSDKVYGANLWHMQVHVHVHCTLVFLYTGWSAYTLAGLPIPWPVCLRTGESAYAPAGLPTHRRVCLRTGRSAYAPAGLPTHRPVCLHTGESAYTLASLPVCLHTGRSAYTLAGLPTHWPVCLHTGRSAYTLAGLPTHWRVCQSAYTLAGLPTHWPVCLHTGESAYLRARTCHCRTCLWPGRCRLATGRCGHP